MKGQILWAALAVATVPAASLAGQSAEPLTIDALYSLPRIIGTAPSAYSWSADSTRVAFLWNNEGGNLRDLWMARVDGGEPLRLTSLPRRSVANSSAGVEALRNIQQAEQEPGAAAVTWFPDGKHLLLTFTGQFYRVTLEGGLERLFAAGRQARFSPDGTVLSFIRSGDLWVARVTGGAIGTPRNLTSLAADGIGLSRYAWSPDSRSVAVLERDQREVERRTIPDYLVEETSVTSVARAFPGQEPGRTRLSVVQVESGTSRPMQLGTDDRDLVFSFAWSPDAERLLVDKSDLYVKDRRLLSVSAVTGEAAQLYREAEPDNVTAYWSAAWAADGVGAYFISDRDDFYHLYYVAHAGDEPHALTAGDWAVDSFHVADDAVYLVANREHPSERHVYRVGAQGGEPQRVSQRAGTHTPVYSPDGRWAAVHFSSDQAPAELFLNRLDGIGERRVTASPLAEFAERDWVEPQYVTFPSHVDGVTLHGRLLLPPDFDPSRTYPAIIGSIYAGTLRNQWGGRTAHPTWGLDQYLVQHGYVLLNIDIRGSWGHGRAFRRKMRRDYGGMDTEDIFSGVKYLGSLGTVDMGRVGLWGSSYGGLMTAMSLFKRPGVFAAGVAGAPATNVWHAMTGEMMVMGTPQDEPEAYARSSAVTHAAGLQDPLMIIHGMRDRIVLFKDSLVLLETLMLLGKAELVEFVPLPNSPHGWDTRELYQTRFAFKKLVGHFDRYLKADLH